MKKSVCILIIVSSAKRFVLTNLLHLMLAIILPKFCRCCKTLFINWNVLFSNVLLILCKQCFGVYEGDILLNLLETTQLQDEFTRQSVASPSFSMHHIYCCLIVFVLCQSLPLCRLIACSRATAFFLITSILLSMMPNVGLVAKCLAKHCLNQ